ncbi:hypothetical protein CCB80_10300 [Armatimonadetes bacterium Uphvl-Ar1]|nr:hypothetical protein CCB80_10300 [Armatimonadetes bacterium Uphvl-Ar1]
MPRVKKKLCIDPGHGLGNRSKEVYDPGAISAGVSEADIVLAYGLAIKWIGKSRGIDVFLTRESENEVTPVGRRDNLASEAGCDLFVSLHCNAASPSANGTETFYRDDEDKKLAKLLNSAVLAALQFRDRGVKHESKTQHPRLSVLDFDGPACLIELGFISNTNNREKLLLRSSRLAVAHAILDTLEKEYGLQ